MLKLGNTNLSNAGIKDPNFAIIVSENILSLDSVLSLGCRTLNWKLFCKYGFNNHLSWCWRQTLLAFGVNTMPTDALDHKVSSAPAGMILSMQDKQHAFLFLN